MWKITNTANDRSKVELHRLAAKFTYEPSIDGIRLRLGESREFTDEHFATIRAQVESWKLKGIVDFEQVEEPFVVSPPPPVVEAPKSNPEPRAGTPVVEAAPAPEAAPEGKKSQGKKRFM